MFTVEFARLALRRSVHTFAHFTEAVIALFNDRSWEYMMTEGVDLTSGWQPAPESCLPVLWGFRKVIGNSFLS